MPVTPQFRALNERTAWFLDGAGRLHRTEDGGLSWSSHAVSPKAWPSNMCFLSETQGWEIDQSSHVLETFDGGRTWQRLCALRSDGLITPHEMFFADEEHGWIVTGLSVWRTVNGGRRWEEHSFETNSVETSPPEHEISACQFLDADNGWLVTNEGSVYHTGDGSLTWELRKDGSKKEEPSSNGIFFINDKVGWAGDALGGGVNHTNDGGRTWTQQANPSTLHFIDTIFFFNEKDGLLVGAASGQDAFGFTIDGVFDDVIMRTTDGGETWATQRPALNPISGEPPVDPDAGALVTLVVPDGENQKFINSWQGWAASDSDVYRTDDGGRSWRHVLHVDLPSQQQQERR